MKDTTILPTWRKQDTNEFRESIPGIDQKVNQTSHARKIIADNYIESQFPNKCWTHVYTDGSAENATENGGGGILINLKSGEQKKLSIATGRNSNNYRAEAVAIKVGTENLMTEKATYRRVVILTDALSVITALKNNSSEELHDLQATLAEFSSTLHKSTRYLSSINQSISSNLI
jgi:ribonuclease HI